MNAMQMMLAAEFESAMLCAGHGGVSLGHSINEIETILVRFLAWSDAAVDWFKALMLIIYSAMNQLKLTE